MSSISGVTSGSSMLDRSAELFKKFDTSGDGSIDFEEFKAAGPKDGKGGPGGVSPEEMFKKIDTNGDGKIDEAEHTTFMKQMESQRPQGPPPSGPPPSESGSGTASDTTSLAELLKQIDTNSDNTIDEDEQESFLKLMEDRRKEEQASIQSYTENAQGKSTMSSLFSVLA
jgi:Ca2+-binding EF-hand superfamily protein